MNISKEAVERACSQCDLGLLSDQPMGDLCRALLARVEELTAALRDVREEICIGPVNDVLWHRSFPSETTVDFICNTLGDGWDYDEWLENRNFLEALKEQRHE